MFWPNIGVLQSNPLHAKSCLSRADLKGETAVCFAGIHFDDWQRVVMEVLGKGVKLKFHMKPLSSLQNIAITDIGPMLHICGHEYMRKHFSSRSDVVIVDRLDGKELRYPSALVYRRMTRQSLCRYAGIATSSLSPSALTTFCTVLNDGFPSGESAL